MNGDERQHRAIGRLAGCEIDLLVGLPSTIDADLVVAAFMSSGHGIDHKDDWLSAHDPALGGLLDRLRNEDLFEGRLCETLLISRPTPVVRAGAVMMLGLGPQDGFSASELVRAIACAGEQAMLLESRHVAFASGLLTDEGERGDQGSIVSAMLRGLHEVLSSKAASLGRWTFLVGASCLSQIAVDFEVALARLSIL